MAIETAAQEKHHAGRSDTERLLGMADLLAEFARLMEEQSNFHAGAGMENGLESVRYAAALAKRRAASMPYAGTNWLRQIERTLLSELVRASAMAAAVTDEAGTEAWDFESAMTMSRNTLSLAAMKDVTLFHPDSPEAEAVRQAAFAGQGAGDWSVTGGSYNSVGPLGVPLSVIPWSEGREYLAQVAFTGVGVRPDPLSAARLSRQISGMLFGEPPAETGVPVPAAQTSGR